MSVVYLKVITIIKTSNKALSIWLQIIPGGYGPPHTMSDLHRAHEVLGW